jgi:hypothetical protein
MMWLWDIPVDPFMFLFCIVCVLALTFFTDGKDD